MQKNSASLQYPRFASPALRGAPEDFLSLNRPESMSTKYEVMAIITSSLDEKAALQQANDSVIKRIKDLKGNVTFEDFWGARGFAYIIKKAKWGYYFVAQFEMEESDVLEFKKELNIDGKIVRFLLTRVNPKDPAPRKYEQMKKEWESLEKETKIESKLSEMDAPKKKTAKPEVKKESISTEVAPDKEEKKVVKAEVKKTSAPKKDLVDRKLDEILEDSSLDL